MDRKLLVMNKKDNVGMALQDTKKNDILKIILNGKVSGDLKANEDIDIYHKYAIANIPKDSQVIKYGELIGIATENIKVGDHVHVNNVRSVKV